MALEELVEVVQIPLEEIYYLIRIINLIFMSIIMEELEEDMINKFLSHKINLMIPQT